MTGRNVTRYMRVDKMIQPFKDRLDAGNLTLPAEVDRVRTEHCGRDGVCCE